MKQRLLSPRACGERISSSSGFVAACGPVCKGHYIASASRSGEKTQLRMGLLKAPKVLSCLHHGIGSLWVASFRLLHNTSLADSCIVCCRFAVKENFAGIPGTESCGQSNRRQDQEPAPQQFVCFPIMSLRYEKIPTCTIRCGSLY